MREEINRILKLVEEGKLTGDQASAMIDALDQAERRARGSASHADAGESRRRHRARGARASRDARAFGGLLDELGIDIGRTVEDALRGVRDLGGIGSVFAGATGDDWVDDTNSATLAKTEAPTGEDFRAEGNRIVVSELARLSLRQAEFCDNTMHAAALQDVEVVNGPLSRNALRGSSLKRASLTASEVTGNTLNGASLSRLAVTSSVFKDNTLNGSHIRDLDLQGAQIRSAQISGTKLKNVTLTDGAMLDAVEIAGVVGGDWTLAAATLSGVKFAAARVARLNVERTKLIDCAFVRGRHGRHGRTGEAAQVRASLDGSSGETRIRDLTLTDVDLKGCEFVDCTFDGTTIKDVEAENLRFVNVDFTGMTIDSTERFKVLASAADAA